MKQKITVAIAPAYSEDVVKETCKHYECEAVKTEGKSSYEISTDDPYNFYVLGKYIDETLEYFYKHFSQYKPVN